jgi:protein-S-isoprenylcysteine O-methyltransferase Ste14
MMEQHPWLMAGIAMLIIVIVYVWILKEEARQRRLKTKQR